MAVVFPFILGGLGAFAVVRGVFRPTRAVVKKGTVARCAGSNQFRTCDPTLTITAPEGASVHSTVSGKVVVAGETFVQIMGGNETVILMYQGLAPTVVEGQHVGRGQKLGVAQGPVHFGVWQLRRTNGGVTLDTLDPSSWLAARGMRVVQTNIGPGNLWCEAGRHIKVPASVKRTCDLSQVDRASFALLPVSVEMG